MKKIPLLIFLILLPLIVNAEKDDIHLDVKQHTFSNGLELLVVERHLSPTFSAIVRFKAGSADEKPGITGTAHLLEHMLFKGTKNIGTANHDAEIPIMDKIDIVAHYLSDAINESRNPLYRGGTEKIDSLRSLIADLQKEQKQYIIKDEFWETYLRHGGLGLNASTGNDGTQYYVSLPSNKLELWAYMESDRLANPILREFYSERDVVYEERRLSIDNSPSGKLYEQLNATAFTASSYSWPILGWASDLETVLREEVEEFFRQYYSPNNIVIAIVGDVKFDEVVKLVEKYFGNIPPSEKPVPPVTTMEPEQEGERRVAVAFDAEPRLAVGWHMMAGGDVDQEVFDVISNLLTSGRTSRLYKSLVEKKQMVSSIRAISAFTRFPDIFTIVAIPKAGYSVEEVEKAIYEEIDRLQNEGPTGWELQRVRNQLEADYVRGLQSNRGMAFGLANMQAQVGDWGYLLILKEKRRAVTADDVKRVLAEYFTEDNRTVAYLVKPDRGISAESAKIQKLNKRQAVKK
ncbi:MAG: insulinase family protein [Candidatus Zixiibacteriota bacterium]|nr:MAG: insulinase family protein [candidate division Zixibacteria bacterium]